MDSHAFFLSHRREKYAANREALLAKRRLRDSKNKVKIKTQQASWNKKNAISRSAIRKKTWYKHREKRLKEARIYRDKNRHRCIAATMAWKQKNPDRVKQQNTRMRAGLCDGYVRSLLVTRGFTKPVDIPDELVELKRIQIQLKRELKNKT